MYLKEKHSMSVFDLYMQLILIMPLTTLFQGQIDFLNKAVFIIIFLLQMIILVKYKMKLQYAMLLMISFIIYMIGIYNTNNLKMDNTIVYYINWIIYATVILVNKNRFYQWILKSRKYIYVITWIWTVLVAVSIPLPSSYYIKEGGGHYFGSYCQSIFRLGPTALFIGTLAVIMIEVYKDRKAILFELVPLYCGLMGSSRTYLVIIGLVAVAALFFFSKSKKQFLLMLLPAVFVFAVAYGSSSIAEKIAYTKADNHYGDFLFRITSSRSYIWSIIIQEFRRQSLFRRFIGGGYNFSRDLLGHYAHNDFIEILATHGYIGVILYLYSIFGLLRDFYRKNTSVVLIVLSVTVWLFNAMFNMFYYYICAALSFPFLLLAIDHYTGERQAHKDAGRKKG